MQDQWLCVGAAIVVVLWARSSAAMASVKYCMLVLMLKSGSTLS